MTPRPYQERALAQCRDEFRAGHRAVILVSPTGSGKTCMGAMMAAAHVARGGRVVWTAHRQELLTQAADTLTSMGLTVGLRGMNASASVQIASIGTILARGHAPEATLVISDEAHHDGKENERARIVSTYLAGGACIVGLTATPARGDDRALEGYQAIVVAAQVGELQALGHLVPLRIKRPVQQLRKDRIAQRPVDAYLELTPWTSAVVFAPHTKASEAYRADFLALGIRAEIVTGKTPDDERRRILESFAAGELPVVVNVAVLTEGWDATICSTVILGRGCGSQGLYMQMVGRALRPHPGKTHATLLDLRGVSHVLGRPDADREFHLDGDGITLKGSARGDRVCKVCGEPLGELVTCPTCGKRTELEPPKATGDKLVDYEERAYEATKEQLKPRRDVLSLAGLLRKGSEAQALARFRHFFQRHPDERLLKLAKHFNRARTSAAAAFREEA